VRLLLLPLLLLVDGRPLLLLLLLRRLLVNERLQLVLLDRRAEEQCLYEQCLHEPTCTCGHGILVKIHGEGQHAHAWAVYHSRRNSSS
jgi:hypothetical protein